MNDGIVFKKVQFIYPFFQKTLAFVENIEYTSTCCDIDSVEA